MLNNLKSLSKCIFRPELSPLSTEKAILIDESMNNYVFHPVISPYFKQRGYVHCGCCCEPYDTF